MPISSTYSTLKPAPRGVIAAAALLLLQSLLPLLFAAAHAAAPGSPLPLCSGAALSVTPSAAQLLAYIKTRRATPESLSFDHTERHCALCLLDTPQVALPTLPAPPTPPATSSPITGAAFELAPSRLTALPPARGPPLFC